MKDADRSLLQKAGIDTAGKRMAQFYPNRTVNLLAKAEHDHAPNLNVEKIAKTVFGVRPVGKRYEFFVVELRKRGGR